ncbi:lipoprotein ABC transporter permease [Roseospira marina]|uniref:Lipoprotein ABC transporter permease n=1 Tax=Roseospira marina TaxID=140057 RepID=A0A5M6I6N4_9PROT|nr:lipoprotein ABC transporter permease [Roseospira marina]KAA5603914.1 lipoprotein ABC transporter permease [Roseospira marina]MBB4315974.1 putative ABC transport system permease protein [Roseospira marina]MBB5089156.1 putative ABC transport system permease protein [Roseospira marina]
MSRAPTRKPRRSPVGSLALAVYIAVRQVRHTWLTTACYAIALAAVLAPLLVLFGLRNGVVTEMETRLLRDPDTLRITPLKTGTLEPTLLEQLAAQPGTAFLVPRTRPLSLTVDLEAAGGATLSADLEPTAPGDPVLAPGPIPAPGSDAIVLSDSLARALGRRTGDTVPILVTRTLDGTYELAEVEATVLDILPPTGPARAVGFVSLPLVIDIENFRDGHRVPARGWGARGTEQSGPRPFAGFRLYARDLEAVPALVAWLREHGIPTHSSIEDVQGLRMLDRSLGIVFAIILGIGSAGVLLSLGSNLWANVERSRADLGIVRLMGGTSGVLVAIPVIEALLIALSGFVLGALGYAVSDALLSVAFAAPGLEDGNICTLSPTHWVIALLATTGFAALASVQAAARTLSIPAAEGLQGGPT